MRTGIACAVAFAVAMVAPVARAHEGHDHGKEEGPKVMGTVTAVHADKNHIELKAKDGKVVGATVDAKTKYVRGKESAALADVKVRDRAVVSVTEEGEPQKATEVRLSTAKPAAEAGAKPEDAFHGGHKQ